MRKRIALLVVPAALAACGGPRLPSHPNAPTVLTVRGDVGGGPFLLDRKDFSALPQASFRAVDPTTGRAATYAGVALSPVFLDRVELKKGADTAVVTTRGGTAFPVPVRLFQQYRPVLADRIDGAEAPGLVLAWPTESQPGFVTDPRAVALWAHDVVALELVSWERTYARALRVPAGAPDAARLGAATFAARCIGCHQANRVGGKVGPDLSAAAARVAPDAFVAKAEDHHRLAPAGRPDLGPAPDALRNVDAYLRALAAAPPPDEPEKAAPDRERPRHRDELGPGEEGPGDDGP